MTHTYTSKEPVPLHFAHSSRMDRAKKLSYARSMRAVRGTSVERAWSISACAWRGFYARSPVLNCSKLFLCTSAHNLSDCAWNMRDTCAIHTRYVRSLCAICAGFVSACAQFSYIKRSHFGEFLQCLSCCQGVHI